MKTKMLTTLVLALSLAVYSANAAPMGTAFTYQGRLIEDNIAAEGLYDFLFTLHDCETGSQQGNVIYKDNIDVNDGYFTTKLDFVGADPNVFKGDSRCLEIDVRPGDSNDPNDFVPLSPQQEVTATPYALYAKTAGNAPNQPVPQGGIIMWFGPTDSIPDGWALCDGTNGTPDLRDRFIVGAGNSYDVNDTGGEASHALTIDEMPSHTHSSGTLVTNSAGAHRHSYRRPSSSIRHGSSSKDAFEDQTVTDQTGSAGAHTHTISGSTGSKGKDQPHENRPPYYALAYIMKL